MANLLPKDEELFQRIAKEHIYVDPVLWTLIYQYIGDQIILINLTIRYYLDDGNPVPKEDAKKILNCTKRMIEVMKKLDHPETITDDEKDTLFQILKKENLKLDPITDELFGNYVRNDINIINLVCIDYVDPLDEREAVSVSDAKRILEHTRSTMRFLDRLREATSKKEAF